jgi:hypothetical protein
MTVNTRFRPVANWQQSANPGAAAHSSGSILKKSALCLTASVRVGARRIRVNLFAALAQPDDIAN